MTQSEATAQAQKILSNATATAFYDEASPLHPYLVAINTPTGELGVIATGRSYADAVEKAKLWKTLQQKRRVEEPAGDASAS